MTRNSTIKCPNCFKVSTGNTQVLTDSKSINNRLGLLLLTSKGELLGDPNYGTNLMRYIYENNNYILHDSIVEEILTAVDTYEPAIYLSADDITITPHDNKVDISIAYYIKNTGELEIFELSLAKEDENNE